MVENQDNQEATEKKHGIEWKDQGQAEQTRWHDTCLACVWRAGKQTGGRLVAVTMTRIQPITSEAECVSAAPTYFCTRFKCPAEQIALHGGGAGPLIIPKGYPALPSMARRYQNLNRTYNDDDGNKDDEDDYDVTGERHHRRKL